MTDDQSFLPRPKWEPLKRALIEIPAVVEDLAITLTRQDRIQKSTLGKTARRKPESALPLHVGAANASAELQNCLTGWVRLVCEQRQINYMPIGFTHKPEFIGPLAEGQERLPRGYDVVAIPVLAKWLRVNLIALAMTEGSAEAYDDIASCIDACRRQMDLPADDDVVIDAARVESANKSVVTLSTIDAVATRLGAMARGLTRERLRLLAKRGDVKPVGVDPETKTKFYALGDVLHAHHNREKRGGHGGQ